MSPDDYRAAAGYRRSTSVGSVITPPNHAVADRPVPSNVLDGRFWGDDEWAMFNALPQEANSAETAARVSAIYFCCSIIAEAMAVPIRFVDSDYREVSFPLAEVLTLEPNHLQTSAEFWSAMMFAGALRNAAFAEPVATLDGIEIWPLDPLRTSVDWKERSFTLRHYDDEGRSRLMRPQQLFWFTGLGDATARPLVPWKMAKGSIDFQLALEVGGRSFFRNNRRLAGWLSTEQKLTEEGISRVKVGVKRWKQGGIPVLEQGLSFHDVDTNNADAQLTELIKQRTLEMARYWRIPKSMIGEDNAGKANSEQEALDFVKYVARPWGRRIEQAITTRLLPPDLRAAGVRAKMNFDALLRGDSATQWRNAVLARTASVMSVNTLRRDWFNQPPIDEDWANDPREPLNSNRAADTATGGQTAPQDQVN
ncbi:MAG: phage portal protein [Sphingomonas sp.]|nr:phage portal protein [Sphingomonas sp.]|tara:strand:- start:1061 stop:2329 length:1269 start_codon:yes stop_codon:yes gene_type:complete